MPVIKRAILSCHDKTGVVELARLLRELDIEIISTSGTLQVLKEAGIDAANIAEYTGVPELMDGRVKSLHSKVHAGLLGLRDNKLHEEQLLAHGMEWIDMVVVNLQPIEKMAERAGTTMDEVLEQTDIGGAAMIRSAAKNFRYVTVVVNPADYTTVIHELRAYEGEVSYATRYKLAQEAFCCTAEYDRKIAALLKENEPPKS